MAFYKRVNREPVASGSFHTNFKVGGDTKSLLERGISLLSTSRTVQGANDSSLNLIKQLSPIGLEM